MDRLIFLLFERFWSRLRLRLQFSRDRQRSRARLWLYNQRIAIMAPSCASASEMGIPDQSLGCQKSSPVEKDCLHRCLSDLALLDLASKARLLQSLSAYLASVAATMSASTDDYSLSALVGTLEVHLRNVEVIELHKLLVRELENHTEYLAKPDSTSYFYSDAEGDRKDEILSRTLHLEVVSETLRCCIRILPLVDCFDTSVSFSGAALLDALMQQLCSPPGLYDILRSLFNHGRSRKQQECLTSGRTTVDCGNKSELLATKNLRRDFCPRSDSVETIDADSQVETLQRMDVFLAILEVYMDELLLCPDLGARLLSFHNETRLVFKQEHVMSSLAGHTEASLEAAFVHALLSRISKVPIIRAGTTAPNDELLVCNLSLPASLLLLETLAAENVPGYYTTHIAQLVARVLENSASRDLAQEMITSVGLEEYSCCAGGVEWAYCLKKVFKNRDPMEWILRPQSLPSITTIHYASSIFEQAMMLYRKVSASSTEEETCVPIMCQTADNLFLRFCGIKYRPLVDMFSDESELEPAGLFAQFERFANRLLEIEKETIESETIDVIASYSDIHLEVVKSCDCHDCHLRQGGSGSDLFAEEEKGGRNGASSLVSAVLQLGSSSVNCITREVGNMIRLSSRVLQVPRGQPGSGATSVDDVDKILECVSLYLSSFLPSDGQACGKQHGNHSEHIVGNSLVTNMVSRGERSLTSSVGKAILFFTNVFCAEVLSGAPEELIEDYFHLLESLIALLLVVNVRKNPTPSSGPCSAHTHPVASHDKNGVHINDSKVEQPQLDNSSKAWLKAMVSLLQNMLQDLSAQQIPLPEFLLDFVLEQISRGEGLKLVAEAFSGTLEQDLDGQESHQTAVRNVGSFQPKGLVIQILQLALQKPTSSSSFSTLIVYISDILEDLLPITATLCLHEVAGSVSCYKHIASAFTQACQFAVSERVMVIRNGHECRSWLLSRMCESIERLLTEGTAVAHLISNRSCSNTLPAESPCSGMRKSQSSCTVEAQVMCGASCCVAEELEYCGSFLVQIDMLRRAVGAMRSATDWFLIPELEFSSLFLKARSFLETFSRLRMTVDKPPCQRRFHVAEVDSVEQHLVMDNQQEEAKMDGLRSRCDITVDIPIRNSSGSEECEPYADSGKSEEDNFKRSGTDSASSGRGSHCDENVDGVVCVDLVGDCVRDLDAGPISVILDVPVIQTVVSVREHDRHCEQVPKDAQQEVRKLGEGTTLIDHPSNDETSKAPVVSKRLTRSAALMMADSLRSGGEATTPVAEDVDDPVKPPDWKKRQIYSSTTLAIAKRLLETRQPSRKKLKRDTLEFTERSAYTGVLDLVPLRSKEQETAGRETEQPGQKNDLTNLGVVSTEIFSNPYIHCLLGKDKEDSGDDFDDLKDFIVCKKGRNYTKWLNKRQKVRRRLHTRNHFKRLQEKRDLLLLLDVIE